ncbi:hypothetical protein PSCICM_49100 [Pseudomonas cichorii]|uniref:Uncharacterized protein n=1 Tax=Pseudomonas cichorii TaxID=36746 RepID=A0ABQ1DUX5_PSECI|nr:hypothetical protein PSCICM_49100 [Pseudomonas cichorii]GFM94826.1 hypothetical protein PSCICP_47980 [Pseudomonas cichorii]
MIESLERHAWLPESEARAAILDQAQGWATNRLTLLMRETSSMAVSAGSVRQSTVRQIAFTG